MDFNKLTQSNIINTLKLMDAPKEVQREAIEEALEIIFDSVVDRIKTGLSDGEMVAYNDVFRGDSPEGERVMFLKEHVPNLEEMVAEETMRYKYLTEIMVSSLGK